MDPFSRTREEAPLSNKGIQDAYELISAEVSQLKQAKRALEARLQKAEAAKDLLRQLAGGHRGDREIIANGNAQSMAKGKAKKKRLYSGSQTSEVVKRAKEILLDKRHPMQRAELLTRICSDGYLIHAKNPARLVGRALWNDEDFLHIPGQGYWLRHEELPVRESEIQDPNSQTPNSD